MKLSKYNHFFVFNSSYYIYNSLFGSIINFTKDEYYSLKKNKIKYFSEKEKDVLKENGIILDDDTDEFALIEYFFNKSRYNNNTLSLTIVPTLECNFACPYCYERRIKGRMNSKTWLAITNFINSKISELSSINITFYGGEPLLEFDKIKEFINNFYNNGKFYEKFNISIVSNGYLLTPKIVNYLAKISLNSIQITIDGNKEEHDKRRPHIKFRKSYDVITKNINYALNYFNIIIRHNSDRENSNFKINDFLKDIGYPDGHKNLHFYSAELTKVDKCYQNYDFHNNLSFSKTYLQNLVKSINLHSSKPTLSAFKLSPIQTFCGADRINSFTITPNGSIINCWNYLSDPNTVKRNSIGNINNNNVNIDIFKLSNWLKNTSLKNLPDKCKNCSLLPTCLSQCPTNRIRNIVKCPPTKYILKDFVSAYIHLKLSKP